MLMTVKSGVEASVGGCPGPLPSLHCHCQLQLLHYFYLQTHNLSHPLSLSFSSPFPSPIQFLPLPLFLQFPSSPHPLAVMILTGNASTEANSDGFVALSVMILFLALFLRWTKFKPQPLLFSRIFGLSSWSHMPVYMTSRKGYRLIYKEANLI